MLKQLELPMPVTGLPLDLRAEADDIHRSNIAAGWWKTDPLTGRTLNRNIGELLALVHSEISEADEGYAADLMDDKLPHRRMVEVELADTAIRVLDILGFYGSDCQRAGHIMSMPTEEHWPDWCRLMHRTTTDALEGFRKGNVDRGCNALVELLTIIHWSALAFELDLTGAIAEKRAFNAQRADHKLESRERPGGKAF